MRILLAVGAGYIGAHCAVELVNAGHEVVIVDDYRNSSPLAVKRVETITGKKITAYECDICNKAKMQEIFAAQQLDCVIHLAALFFPPPQRFTDRKTTCPMTRACSGEAAPILTAGLNP